MDLVYEKRARVWRCWVDEQGTVDAAYLVGVGRTRQAAREDFRRKNRRRWDEGPFAFGTARWYRFRAFRERLRAAPAVRFHPGGPTREFD